MIPTCDRCGRQLPDRVQSGPGTYEHFRNDLGTWDFLLCRHCYGYLRLFLADAPLMGEGTDRATAT